MPSKESFVNPIPQVPDTLRTAEEFRSELPFSPSASSIYYAGLTLKPNWATPSHYHEHFELCYLDEGSGQYQIDKTLYGIASGQLLLTMPGENHFGLAAGKSAPFRLYYVGLKLERLPVLQLECYRIGTRRIAEDTDGSVKALFVGLMEEAAGNTNRMAPQMAEAILQQLLVTTLRRLHEQTPSVDVPAKPLRPAVAETLNRLHREIRYDHDLDKLAAVIPVSRSHLTREFKAAIGVPLGEYIRNLCLSKAKAELRDTNKPVTEIAEELGFASIHSFSVFFKRFACLAPSEYRKKRRS